MTTARLRNRIEAAENRTGFAGHEHFMRIFYVKGGNGRGPSGHEGGFDDFLQSKGYDTSGRNVVVHFVPWDSAAQCFRAEPIELLKVHECAA